MNTDCAHCGKFCFVKNINKPVCDDCLEKKKDFPKTKWQKQDYNVVNEDG